MTLFSLFFFNDTATTEIYTLSLHDALPISPFWIVSLLASACCNSVRLAAENRGRTTNELPKIVRKRSSWTSFRSEEHTSELQSQSNLVCRLLLEKKKKKKHDEEYKVTLVPS